MKCAEDHLKDVLLGSMVRNGDEIRMPHNLERIAMGAIDPQEFGELRAQVRALIESDKEKTDLLRELNDQVTAMRLTMAEAHGGWRALVAIGGASATLGALCTWMLSHLVQWFGKGTP